MIDTLKALSDPQRLKILKMLAGQEMGACEVINALGLAQPTVSHHLKILRQAKIITSEKQGKMVFYTINKKGLKKFLNKIESFLKELSCFDDSTLKASPLRQNPDLCKTIGYKKSTCEEEL